MNTTKFILIFFSLWSSSFLCHSQEQKMPEKEIAPFKTKMTETAHGIKTMVTDFVQFKHMDFLSKDIESSGKMSFKGPNSLMWQYKKPYVYTISFNNGKIAINDEGKKSQVDASNSEMFKKINKLIVRSVSGDMFDDKEFDISYNKVMDQSSVTFKPKDASLRQYIKQLDLLFDAKDGTVSQVKMVEPAGDYTRILFKNKVLNEKIEDALFGN